MRRSSFAKRLSSAIFCSTVARCSSAIWSTHSNPARHFRSDALDFLGNTTNYAISLTVAGMVLQWRARAAMLKGASLLLLGLWVLGSTVLARLCRDTAASRGHGRGRPAGPRCQWRSCPHALPRLVAVVAASTAVRVPANRPSAAATPSKLRRFMLRLLPVRDVAGVAPDDGQPSAGIPQMNGFKARNSARHRLFGQRELIRE